MTIDLNYRLDLPNADVRGILNSDRWDGRFETLQRYDQVYCEVNSYMSLLIFSQLKKAMRNGKAFEGFTEHPITHPPYA